MFVGRKTELEQLNRLWALGKSSLVVCRGRRRIGKSELIRQFGKTAKQFYEIQGLAPRQGIGAQDQLKHFYSTFGIRPPQTQSWETAFADFSRVIKSDRAEEKA